MSTTKTKEKEGVGLVMGGIRRAKYGDGDEVSRLTGKEGGGTQPEIQAA